jgi:hypothetical protein
MSEVSKTTTDVSKQRNDEIKSSSSGSGSKRTRVRTSSTFSPTMSEVGQSRFRASLPSSSYIPPSSALIISSPF